MKANWKDSYSNFWSKHKHTALSISRSLASQTNTIAAVAAASSSCSYIWGVPDLSNILP